MAEWDLHSTLHSGYQYRAQGVEEEIETPRDTIWVTLGMSGGLQMASRLCSVLRQHRAPCQTQAHL